MSHFDYLKSHELSAQDPPFDALIMAAMRKADTVNSMLLNAAFPHLAAELQRRYNAPGGYLPGENDQSLTAVSCVTAGDHQQGSDHRWQECPTYHEDESS